MHEIASIISPTPRLAASTSRQIQVLVNDEELLRVPSSTSTKHHGEENFSYNQGVANPAQIDTMSPDKSQRTTHKLATQPAQFLNEPKPLSSLTPPAQQSRGVLFAGALSSISVPANAPFNGPDFAALSTENMKQNFDPMPYRYVNNERRQSRQLAAPLIAYPEQWASNRFARQLTGDTPSAFQSDKRAERYADHRKEEQQRKLKYRVRISNFLEKIDRAQYPKKKDRENFAATTMGVRTRALPTYVKSEGRPSYDNLKLINKFAQQLNEDGTLKKIAQEKQQEYCARIQVYIQSFKNHNKLPHEALAIVAHQIGFYSSYVLRRYLTGEATTPDNVKKIHAFARRLPKNRAGDVNQNPTGGMSIQHSMGGTYNLAPSCIASDPQQGAKLDFNHCNRTIKPAKDSIVVWGQSEFATFGPTATAPALRYTGTPIATQFFSGFPAMCIGPNAASPHVGYTGCQVRQDRPMAASLNGYPAQSLPNYPPQGNGYSNVYHEQIFQAPAMQSFNGVREFFNPHPSDFDNHR